MYEVCICEYIQRLYRIVSAPTTYQSFVKLFQSMGSVRSAEPAPISAQVAHATILPDGKHVNSINSISAEFEYINSSDRIDINAYIQAHIIHASVDATHTIPHASEADRNAHEYDVPTLADMGYDPNQVTLCGFKYSHVYVYVYE